MPLGFRANIIYNAILEAPFKGLGLKLKAASVQLHLHHILRSYKN